MIRFTSQNQIQTKQIIMNEPRNTKKTGTTITRKNPKQNLNEFRNNKQNQQQNYNIQKERVKNNSRAHGSLGPRNSVRLNNIQNQGYNINNRNPKNSWLNKYFIYRHDSLNNYLFKDEFKNTLDNLKENYNKQLIDYRKKKTPTIIQNKNPTSIKPSNASINSNSINDTKNKNNNNNNNQKKFIVTGGYSDVVKNLTERNWVREKNAKSLEFDYIWTLKTNEINFIQIKPEQMANHYFRNGQITRKSGLSKNIKNLYYLGIDPMNFFPRCYDLSVKNELEDFKQDFKFTWTISLLILFQKEANEKGNTRTTSQQFTTEVIETAINIIQRHLFLLEPNGALRDINNLRNSQGVYLINDKEWNIIYLSDLRQNSNIQDIIYEVNSNKPGGVNNPIKGKSNTVQKKIIGKPNQTKNFLINMPKSGFMEDSKVSPNIKSTNGLLSKLNQISQMNLEEKKNNNYNSNNNNNKNNNINNINNNKNIIRKKVNLENKPAVVPQDNKIIKHTTIIRNGAPFQAYIAQVNSLLNSLKDHLPQYKLNGFRNIWILKPSNLSRGRGVTCVNSLEPIEQSLSATNDSGVIVQKYIENPLIISKRKFDIRQWVLVTSLNPLVIWMWKEPYLRFGAEDYIMDDLNNIYSHLTNNSIAKHSTQYKNEKNFEGDMWTCFDFENYIGPQKWNEIHEKIKNAIICSFYAIHQEIKHRHNSHELYGYDFMIDEDLNVYLIEVNASPALDYSTKITERLVKAMVKNLIELVIDNDNARKCNNLANNKFMKIFDERNMKIEIPKNVPNKNIFY